MDERRFYTRQVYVFIGHTGKLLRTLVDPGLDDNGLFGGSVAVGADLIVVGDPASSNEALFSGAAYVFSASTGALVRRLLNPVPGSDAWFDSSRLYREIGGGGNGRGFNIAVADPLDGGLLQPIKHFDTWLDAAQCDKMVEFLNGLPKGRSLLLLLAVADEAGLNRYDRCDFWDDRRPRALLTALEALGSKKLRNGCYRGSWAMAVRINEDGKSEALGEGMGTGREACVQVALPTQAN